MLARGDVADVAAWIASVDFALWPQQHRIDDQLRPAMVNDLAWQGFGARTDALVERIMREHFSGFEDCNRMLSVVMPGHAIPPHTDAQVSHWLARVHVPLVTNPRAVMMIGDAAEHWEVGGVYPIDTRVEHAIRNDGDTPRIHLMFDVRRA